MPIMHTHRSYQKGSAMNLPSSSLHLFNSVARKASTTMLGVAMLGASAAQADIGDFITRLFPNTNIFWVSRNTPSQQIHIKVSGTIVFTPAEDDVQSLTGKAVFQEKRGGRVMRMVFEAKNGDTKGGDTQGGTITRTFTIDGKPQVLDANSRRWLAEMLPNLIRETGMDSEQRIKRFYAQGGADAVLAETERIQSDSARGRYIKSFAAAGPLDEKSLLRLLSITAKTESDFERRGALTALINSQTLSAAQQVVLLNIVAAMDSSFEQRSVLTVLAPKLSADAAVAQAWLATLDNIDSAFEQRLIIDALARVDSLTPLQLDLALQSTRKIDSDFERATALTALIKHLGKPLGKPAPAQVDAYLQSAQQIDSDFERRNVLVKLVNRATLDASGYASVLQAINGMDSDFEICAVLTAIAKKMPADRELVARYRSTARELGDFERGQAEKALDHLNL